MITFNARSLIIIVSSLAFFALVGCEKGNGGKVRIRSAGGDNGVTVADRIQTSDVTSENGQCLDAEKLVDLFMTETTVRVHLNDFDIFQSDDGVLSVQNNLNLKKSVFNQHITNNKFHFIDERISNTSTQAEDQRARLQRFFSDIFGGQLQAQRNCESIQTQGAQGVTYEISSESTTSELILSTSSRIIRIQRKNDNTYAFSVYANKSLRVCSAQSQTKEGLTYLVTNNLSNSSLSVKSTFAQFMGASNTGSSRAHVDAFRNLDNEGGSGLSTGAGLDDSPIARDSQNLSRVQFLALPLPLQGSAVSTATVSALAVSCN